MRTGPVEAGGDGADLDRLLARIRGCRICRHDPAGRPLPHEPLPIFRVSSTARIAVCSQAPGARAHAADKPFCDPSGVRLREWMGLDEATFYDADRIMMVPMGFCFPGQDAHGSDLPPRRECVRTWHDALFASVPQIELVLAIGQHALGYHLPERKKQPLTTKVAAWREISAARGDRLVFPLPHPSWRNTGWIRRNPWFEAELLPMLRAEIGKRL